MGHFFFFLFLNDFLRGSPRNNSSLNWPPPEESFFIKKSSLRECKQRLFPRFLWVLSFLFLPLGLLDLPAHPPLAVSWKKRGVRSLRYFSLGLCRSAPIPLPTKPLLPFPAQTGLSPPPDCIPSPFFRPGPTFRGSFLFQIVFPFLIGHPPPRTTNPPQVAFLNGL